MLRATTKKGEGGQLQTKRTNKCTAVTCDMCLFSLYFVKYLIFIFINSLLKNHFYNMQLALRKFVLEDGDLQLKKPGGSQRNLRG